MQGGDGMRRYSHLKKAFSFLETAYGFKPYMKQKSGSYYYIAYTNEKRDIMVLYDDTVNEKAESPIWIRVYDADSLGTSYDDVDVYRSEMYPASGSPSPKERIRFAAAWLKGAIDDGTVKIE